MVKITIFDINGRKLEKLVDQMLNTGSYKVDFNGDNYASGIYYYQIESGSFVQTKKMILIK